ncbi:MAG: hypothetical protein K6F63_01925 [Lachnospiraceae bacterium]|nr:hypothetical protein [Lachnospiraceae bacterium]
MRKKKVKKDWPFENSGFLTGRQLFEILLLKRKNELERELLREDTEETEFSDLICIYRKFLSESVLGLSENEREFLMKESGEQGKDAGNLRMLLAYTDWTVNIGSCCTMPGNHGAEISVNGQLFKKAAFFKNESREEEERQIRILTIEETGRELTGAEPFTETDDFMSIRPPAGNWGMRIKGRNGRRNEKHFL